MKGKELMGKLSAKDADIEFLDELIGRCEESMSGRFKKKKPEHEMAEDDGPSIEMDDDDREGELSDEDLAELMAEMESRKRG